MTRPEILQALRSAKIQDVLETDVWRENDPLVIMGFNLENGHTVYLKSIKNSESVELSIGHPAEEAELRSFREKLATSRPDSFFDFYVRHISLDTIRQLVEEHAAVIKATGWGANEIYNGNIRVRFD